MLDESSDSEFIVRFKKTFSLNDIEFRSLLSDVKSFRKREQEEWASKEKTVEDLINDLQNSNDISKRKRFKMMGRIARLSKGIGRESVFGGRYIQKRLTREHNRKVKNQDKIDQLSNQLKKNRIMPFMITGEANRQGNRFFNFTDLSEGSVIYKPSKGKKIAIIINIPKGWKKDLLKVSQMAMDNKLSITVRLSEKYLYIAYDEEKLNGYAVDEVSRRKEVSEIKKQRLTKEVESESIKDIYKKYYDLQREAKLKGKKANRCIAVDMNPTNIGFSVLDKTSNSSVKVVYCGIIDLDKLCRKTGLPPTSVKSKYLNNKRHYEITLAVKYLFNVARHFLCSSFVIEDLSFKNTPNMSREANRKTKNIWNRELFVGCVRRRCNEHGIELVEINPCYSSFIGNIQHPYADACNASVEIGRRGLYRFENGGFYPHITSEDIRTLEAKFGNVVECSTDSNWVEIYKSLKNSFESEEFSYRLRTGVDGAKTPHKSFSIFSYKSCVKLITFK